MVILHCLVVSYWQYICVVAGCYGFCWSWNYTGSQSRETSDASL